MTIDTVRDQSEHLRLHWGESLAETLHRRVHREVTRHNRVSAVMVPPDWYEKALHAHPGPALESVTSRVGRVDVTRLLDSVEYHEAHVAITRYGRPAALFVPPDWYRAATEALAAPGSGDGVPQEG